MHRTAKIRFAGLTAALTLLVASMGLVTASAEQPACKGNNNSPHCRGTKVVGEGFFFHGDSLDQVTKLVPGVAGPTFDQQAPTGEDPVVQVASGLSNADGSLGAFWVGPFEGTVDGELELTFFYTAPSPSTTLFYAVSFAVFGDPEGPNTLLGARDAALVPGTGEDPRDVAEFTVTIPVQGTVAESLRIEILPFAAFAHLPIYYDSVDRPSGFVLPTVVECQISPNDPDCA